ncbi:BTAD domain-containing putative transcriptional regulator [Candidatus Leptofilum sp.]|uniref:BTAD domain-containing putative transcriptional regulator n=1 Tax=Candidatus Leptofilum sp. TaxID=3241576 RepID=UPI003B59BA0E
MTTLNISVLGKLHIQQGGQPLPGLVARKSQALLCYLAFTGQPHSRQALAGLLWSEMDEEKARRNLRVALSRMKDELADHLVIQRRTLAFNKERPYWLDVTEFETTLKQKELSIDELKQATDLYRGPFLDDFNLRDAPLFEEWVRLQQEHYRQLALDGLYRLSAMQTEAQQFNAGIETLNRLLQLEPWMEEAHRQLMLLLAVSGQRTAALAQYETCAALLDKELGVEPASETVALYQKIRAEELDDLLPHLAIVPSPAPKPWPPPFQVPASIPHFVGRASQQQAIVQTLQSDEVTAVQAIVGMGGVGKSTLAAQIAAQLQGHFPDGVLWANAATSEPMSVLESWAQLYGYDFSAVGDVESMAAAFRSALADKRVLLVLDDVRSAARIRPLLPSGPNCRVLLTMRDQDLARVLNAQVWSLQELSSENGRLLFRRILGEARVATEPEAAAAICDELANLPLAVEITAQRLKSRPRRKLADWAARLRDEKERLSLLTISDREVCASFALSWETLDRDLKRVFALLGLFAGRSFAAEAVAHIAEMDAYLLEDKLYALVALSLLREEGQTRYQLHPLLADFAREQLREDVEGEVNGRFAYYYLQFAQQYQTDYDALRPEWDNLMAAMEAAHTHQLHQTVIDFADALNDAWFARGRFTQARQAFAWTYKAATKQQDQKKLADNWLRWGYACAEQGDFAKARESFNYALATYKQLAELLGVANAYSSLARIAHDQSQYDDANHFLDLSLQIRESLQDETGLAKDMEARARILHRQWQYEEAHKLIHKVVSMQQKASNKLGIVQAVRLMIDVELALHNQQPRSLQSLEVYCDQILDLCHELHDQGELAAALYSFSRVELAQGNFEQATTSATESLALLERIGDRRSQAIILGFIAKLKQQQENYEAAIATGNECLQILENLGDLTELAITYYNIGYWHNQLDQRTEAIEAWQNTLEIAKQIEHQGLINKVTQKLGA